MLPIFGFKLFGNPGAKLFRVSPLGQTLIHDHNVFYTTGGFYDSNTFGSPYAVQFGRYIFHLTPDLVWRYDTITNTNSGFRNPPNFTYQNHYENSGGIYLSFDGAEWYLTYLYVSGSSVMRAERYRFSNQTWATSGTFASAGDNMQPGFRYFFNNNVFWFSGGTCYRYDTLAMTAGTVSGFSGDHRASSMCMHNSNIYLAMVTNSTTLNIYQFVGGAWNLVQTITGPTALLTTTPTRLFSDGTDMYVLFHSNVINVGWRCYKINGMTLATSDVSAAVLPAFLRTNGLSASAFKGFHVDSHTNPASPEIWLTYTAAWGTAGSSLAWYRWMGESTLMQYGGDAGEGGPDYFLSYDWSGGGHYAWTPGEPYAVMDGAPTAIVGSKTRIFFRIYASNLLADGANVEVQLHYSTDLEPPRTLATISNPELIEAPPETFNTPGSSTWVCPAGVTSVLAECYGAGGGSVIQSVANGGAGGGAYARGTVAVTPGNSYPYTVGAGGTAADGGDTFFDSALTVMAKGGLGRNPSSNAGAAGGSSVLSVGTIKFSGGAGGHGQNADHIGGGGAAASFSGVGSAGCVVANAIGGVGVFPAGSGGNAGANGIAPGGGGGGGGVGTTTTGAAGRLVLTYAVANQGSEINSTTVQVAAGETRLWSIDWHHATDGIAPGTRVSLAVRAIGV